MTVNHGNNGNSKGGDIDILDFSLDDSNVVDFSSLDEFDVEENDEYEFCGLCVPQDPIEDIEWFPNFKDDRISLNNFFCDENEKKQSKQGGVVGKRVVLSEKKNFERRDDNEMVPSKKPRSKRVTSKDDCWSNFLPMKKEVDDSWSSYLSMKKDEKYNGGVKRICMHCGADSTPLWRMGPSGPNTLCNACGVRYRTGRLVPEYRPLNSPTYDRERHSNSHKKIMKMKMRKGIIRG